MIDHGRFEADTAKFKNIRTEDQHELPCHASRQILAILGALPVKLTHPYLPSLSVTKSSLVYCVVVYSIVSYDVIYAVISEKRMYDEEDPSSIWRDQHLEHILAMLPHLLGFHVWLDVPSLLFTLESYKNVQAKFRAATGRSLVNHRGTKEKSSILLAIFGLSLIFGVLQYCSPPRVQFNLLSGLACLYGNVLAICSTYVWLGLSWGIQDAANDTKEEFRKQLNFMTPSRVYEFRLVWLSMRSTLDSMENLQSVSAVYSVSMCALVVIFYEGAVLIQRGEMALALGHLISGSFYVGLVIMICRTSQLVQDEMKCLVGEVLPKVFLTSYDIKTQREIVMLFLIESARPAVTNFRGFITVNKNLILSFFSNISTYMIVLVQFNPKGEGFGV